MKFQKVNIATAQIRGLEQKPYYFNQKCFWACDIKFFNTSCIFFDHIPFIKVGNTKEEANIVWEQLKDNFAKAGIREEDKVTILFEDNGHTLAIGQNAGDYWIDVGDKFAVKTFEELDITFSSLKVW